MIMLTLYFMDDVPFKTVYVHGLVRDGQGQKMSKSKGNVLDPIDLIDGIELEPLVTKRTTGMMQPQMREKIAKQTRKEFPDGLSAYGTDALRFTFYSLASTGRDIKFDIGRIEGYRNFCNKIWNATRYVLMNTEEHDCGQDGSDDYQLSIADRWIISRLQDAEQQVIDGIETYRFDLASQALYDFVWSEYCDWYLELSKPILWDDNAPDALKKGTRRTLIRVLESIMRLAHPMMPFITEEVWQKIHTLAGVQGETIMRQPFPMPDDSQRDATADADIEWIKQIIMGVRNIRGEINISPGKLLPLLFQNGGPEDQRRLNENAQYLTKLANLESVQWLDADAPVPPSATALVGEMEIFVPMAGVIDKDAELARLNKELGKLNKEIGRLKGKLSNEKFIANAPDDVIAKERQKLSEAESAVARLEEQKAKIIAL